MSLRCQFLGHRYQDTGERKDYGIFRGVVGVLKRCRRCGDEWWKVEAR